MVGAWARCARRGPPLTRCTRSSCRHDGHAKPCAGSPHRAGVWHPQRPQKMAPGTNCAPYVPPSPTVHPSAPLRGHCVTAQAAVADATCARVSRLAICTNHPLARARPDPDANGSLTTTRKSDDDVTTKPPAIARFLRGHAARMPCPPLRDCTVSLLRTYSTAASPGAPCGPGVPRGPWDRRPPSRAASPSAADTATWACAWVEVARPSGRRARPLHRRRLRPYSRSLPP